MFFHCGSRRDRRRGLVGAGAIGPDVAGGWCSGWRRLARVARGDRMVLPLAQSARTWPVAGVAAGAGALGWRAAQLVDLGGVIVAAGAGALGWRVAIGWYWRWRDRSGRGRWLALARTRQLAQVIVWRAALG